MGGIFADLTLKITERYVDIIWCRDVGADHTTMNNKAVQLIFGFTHFCRSIFYYKISKLFSSCSPFPIEVDISHAF